MEVLSRMYGTYDATCWLNRPRKALEGKTAAEILKEGDFAKVEEIIKKESRFKKLKQKA